jgi:hypothetical protein
MIKITEKTEIESLIGKAHFEVDLFEEVSEKFLIGAKISVQNAGAILKILNKKHIAEMDGQFDLKTEDLKTLLPFIEEPDREKIKDLLSEKKDISIEIGICQTSFLSEQGKALSID